MRTAQSSMILIIIVLAMFAGIAIFLLQIAGDASRQGFTSMYANSLLQSVMRTDTGYTDERCRTVADLVTCACFSSTWTCGEVQCGRLANDTMSRYMDIFEKQTSNMKYLFTSTSDANCVDSDGNPMTLEIGDGSLKRSRESIKIFSQPLVITKSYAGGDPTYMRMQLIIAQK